jgi:hypothetical protein
MAAADRMGLPFHPGDEELRIPSVVVAYKAGQKDLMMERNDYAFACHDGRRKGEKTHLTSC